MKVTERKYYMDEILNSNLDLAKKMVKKDFDFVMVIDGGEGAGKSVLAQQIAYYFDNNLTLDNVCFTPENFRNQVINAEPGSCIILDEGFGSLSSRQSLSITNKAITDMLTEVRQKNLFIIVVLPSIFDLDRYVSMWRSRCLIHVYLNGIDRGYFTFFNQQKKKMLLTLGRKTYNYSCIKSNFKGRFVNFYTVDEQAYREKKLTSLRSLKDLKNIDKNNLKEQVKELVCCLYHHNMSITDIHKIWNKFGELSPTRRTLQNWIKDGN